MKNSGYSFYFIILSISLLNMKKGMGEKTLIFSEYSKRNNPKTFPEENYSEINFQIHNLDAVK